MNTVPVFIFTEKCNKELGMKSKRIPDENITSSSKLNSHHEPFYARLNGVQLRKIKRRILKSYWVKKS